MFLIGNALLAIADLLGAITQLYVWILIGHIIISWINADPMNPIVRFIRAVSEPFLSKIRRFVPPIAGLDFSVLVAILLVQVVVGGFLVRSLRDIALTLR